MGHVLRRMASSAGDVGVAAVRGVLVEQGRGGGGVAQPAHQFLGGGAGGRGEGGAGVRSSCGRTAGKPRASAARRKIVFQLLRAR